MRHKALALAAVAAAALLVASPKAQSGPFPGTDPEAAAVSLRGAFATVPAGADAISAVTTYPAIRNWSPQMLSSATIDLPSPEISLDEVGPLWTQPLQPPLPAFPIVESAATLYAGANFPFGQQYATIDKPLGFGFGFHGDTQTGFDASRTLVVPTTDVVPPGGGTQTWSLTFTLRDPALAGAQIILQVDPGTGSVVPASVTTPPLLGGERLVFLDTTGGHLWWSVFPAVVGTSYVLTFQVQVPNGTGPVRYRPPAYFEALPPEQSGDGGVGTSTAIADAVLGGTFTYSLGTPVHWTIDTGWSVGAQLGQLGPVPVPVAPRDALTDARAQVLALVASSSPADALLLRTAAAALGLALSQSLWVDSAHPTAMGGFAVFELTKVAVAALQRVRGVDPPIGAIVAADRALATTAIADAAAGNAQLLAQARAQLALGDAATGPPAVERYLAAWTLARRALR